MIRKLKILFLSALLLVLFSPGVLATSIIGQSGAITGTTGNYSSFLSAVNTADAGLTNPKIADYSGTPSLQPLENYMTGTFQWWYLDKQTASSSINSTFTSLTLKPGQNWLVLNGTTGASRLPNLLSTITVSSGQTLNIYITDSVANLTLNCTAGPLFTIQDGGKVNIYGGSLNPNDCYTSLYGSEAISITGSGSLNIYSGGMEIGRTANPAISGGNVNIKGGSVHIIGPNATPTAKAFSDSTNVSIEGASVICTYGGTSSPSAMGLGGNPVTASSNSLIAASNLTSSSFTSAPDDCVLVDASQVTFYSQGSGTPSLSFTGTTDVIGDVNVNWGGEGGDLTFPQLTIPKDSTFTVPDGATVTATSALTNDGTINVNSGGTLSSTTETTNNGAINTEPGADIGLGATTNKGTIYYAPGTVIAPGTTYTQQSTGTVTDETTGNSGETGTVLTLGLNGPSFTIYSASTGANASTASQVNNVGLVGRFVGEGSSQTNISPWYLSWEVTPLNGDTPTYFDLNAGFTGNWTKTTTPVSVNGTQRNGYISIDDSGFGLQLFAPTGNDNKLTGEVYLVYTNSEGANALTNGVYTLTASRNNEVNPYGIQNPLEAKLNFVVEQSNVQTVTIRNSEGNIFSGPLTVSLTDGRTYQMHYSATGTVNGQSVTTTGNVARWSIADETIQQKPAGNYAVINESTGLITFLQPLAENDYLLVNLSVDGVNAQNNPVLVSTTGNLPVQDVSGIAPIKDPVYVANSEGEYNLIDNLVFMPYLTPVSASDVKFTSSNPDVLLYNASSSSTEPDWVVIAPSGNYTGSTTITATYTGENNETYTTEFVVNFTPTAVDATGVTAAESLSFTLTNLTVQNVDASLTPATTTENVSLSDFNYASSNTAVATVDTFGNVTPVGEGTCTITTTYPGLSRNNTATTTVTVNEASTAATAISLEPTTIYLTPEGTENGIMSADITATVEPENIDPSLVTWTAEEGVTLSETTGLTTTVSSTDATGTYTITASVPGPEETTLTATTTVIVSDAPVVLDPMKTTITADSPDFYTVTVAPTVNPAVEGSDAATVQKVSIFTWSQTGQTDMDCKEANQNADGTWSYTFPVNNTPVNEYYIDASDIIVQAYASTNGASDGNMIMNTTWNYADCGWTEGVIATPYVQDTGFITPSVGNGAVAGTTGQALQMEGIRLSTPIEGVDIVYDVHVQNVGWMDQVSEGVYAGTMHENLQMEAIHISLTGENASQYAVQYQAHVQNIGWMDWVQNGAEAGTTGQGLQMEALRVQVVPAGTALPSNNA